MILSLVLMSCAKEDPAKGISVSTFTSTATVNGTAYLNINSGNVHKQFVPAGTQLAFTIAWSCLGISDATGNFVATTTVDANGKYTIQLPARSDGTAVTVTITGNPLVEDVVNGLRTEKQLFTLSETTVSIIKDFTYEKNLSYKKDGANLSESEAWVEGTYTLNVRYMASTSTDETPIPNQTVVKVTIAKNQFVPARENDMVFTETVKDGGTITIKMPAPTVQMRVSGLVISLESAVILDYTVGTNTNKHIFTMSQTGKIIGGTTVNGGKVVYTRGSQI